MIWCSTNLKGQINVNLTDIYNHISPIHKARPVSIDTGQTYLPFENAVICTLCYMHS
jgi:hypothetical protein